jgi:polygalacturonase
MSSFHKEGKRNMQRIVQQYFAALDETFDNATTTRPQDIDAEMQRALTRRELLQLGAITAGGLLLSPLLNFRQAQAASREGYHYNFPTPPILPNRFFPITHYGAIGDGVTDATVAFQQAIAACSQGGGGHVIVPAGTFLTGAIHLLSNVDLHLEKGATILFSQDPQKYLPIVYTRNGGIELMNYSPFIYAFGQQNIGITGEGIIDGQADANHWWPWKTLGSADVAQLEQMADAGIPVEQRIFGAGHYIIPSFIQPYRCQDVLIQGVTLLRSPNWQLHPVLCRNVIFDQVYPNSLGPNTDGCAPESCDGVLISRCTFNTGDDCIAIKAGKDADGRRVKVPSQNIFITRCTFLAGHGAVTIGSEMTGGVQHVFASDLQMPSTGTLSICLRLKTNLMRGGFMRDIHMDNISANQVTGAGLDINANYGGTTGNYPPIVTDINLTNATVNQSLNAWSLQGIPTDSTGTVRLTNCTFKNAQDANIVEYVQNLQLNHVVVNP